MSTRGRTAIALCMRQVVPRLAMGQVWQAAVLILPLVIQGLASFSGDTWWSIKMGEFSVQQRRPALDVFLAHTPVLPGAANGQWLGQALLYLVYAGLGPTGLRVVAGLLMLAAFGLIMVAVRAAGASGRLAALCVLLAILVTGANVEVRSQLFSYPLFALLIVLLERRRTAPRGLAAIPVILAAWSNVHGGFGVGLILVASYAAGDVLDAVLAPRGSRTAGLVGAARVGLVLLLSIAATGLNPLGFDVYRYLLAVTSHPITSTITEWQPPRLDQAAGLTLAISGLALAGTLTASRRRPSAAEIVTMLVFGYVALSAVRYGGWFGMVLAPVLARHAAAIRPPPWLRESLAGVLAPAAGRDRRNGAVAVLLVALAATAPLVGTAAADRLETAQHRAYVQPTAAADYLATLPIGARLYHYQPWTGYLNWRLWPRQLPFLDNRAEAHPPPVWADYLAVSAAEPGWESILDRYGVDVLALQAEAQRGLIRQAEETGRWTVLYRDSAAVVLGREASLARR